MTGSDDLSFNEGDVSGEAVELFSNQQLINNIKGLGYSGVEALPVELVKKLLSGKAVLLTGPHANMLDVVCIASMVEILSKDDKSQCAHIITPNERLASRLINACAKLFNGLDIELKGDVEQSQDDDKKQVIIGTVTDFAERITKAENSQPPVVCYLYHMDAIVSDDVLRDALSKYIDHLSEDTVLYAYAREKGIDLANFIHEKGIAFEEFELEQVTDQIEHIVYNVEAEALAKANALSDIIRTELVGNTQKCIIFCSTQGDADFVKVILERKGILSEIVQGEKGWNGAVHRGEANNQQGTVSCFLSTGASVADIDVDKFDVVINYGLPDKPEEYIDRLGAGHWGSSLRKVISLVTPLDFSNFHYVRKLTNLNFIEKELPDRIHILRAQLKALINDVKDMDESERDNSLDTLADELLTSDDLKYFLRHAVREILISIPELKSRVRELESTSQEDRVAHKESKKGSKPPYRGRERSSRSERQRADRSRRGGEGEKARAVAVTSMSPKMKTEYLSRIYLEAGMKDNITDQKIRELLKFEDAQKTDVDSKQIIKNIIVRKGYSYVDVPLDKEDLIISKLKKSLPEVLATERSRPVLKATTIAYKTPVDPSEDKSEDRASVDVSEEEITRADEVAVSKKDGEALEEV